MRRTVKPEKIKTEAKAEEESARRTKLEAESAAHLVATLAFDPLATLERWAATAKTRAADQAATAAAAVAKKPLDAIDAVVWAASAQEWAERTAELVPSRTGSGAEPDPVEWAAHFHKTTTFDLVRRRHAHCTTVIWHNGVQDIKGDVASSIVGNLTRFLAQAAAKTKLLSTVPTAARFAAALDLPPGVTWSDNRVVVDAGGAAYAASLVTSSSASLQLSADRTYADMAPGMVGSIVRDAESLVLRFYGDVTALEEEFAAAVAAKKNERR